MKKFINLLIVPLLLAGCSLDIPYDNQFSDPDAITTPVTGRELLASAYSALPNPGYDLALMTDDFVPTYWASRNPSVANQYNWQPSALHDLAETLWPGYYSVIVTLNSLIERLPEIAINTEADRIAVNNLCAEAYTLKAYCYYQLLRLFASDPTEHPEADGIILKDKVIMETLPRSTVADCIAEIRRLLNDALQIGNSQASASWITEDATRLLLSEVELYAGNYKNAAEIASALVDKRGYDCFAPSVYRTLWDGSSCEERIFMFDDPEKSQSYYVGIVYDAVTGDYYSLDPSLASSYGEADCRTEWTVVPFYSQSLGNQSFFGKYNLLRREKRGITFINKMRLSHAVFVAAEAWCLDGNNQSKAIEIINRFLLQRGASEIDTDLTGDALLKEILVQKQKEFVGEGERYFDIKHYRRLLGASIASRIPQADDYRWLWPLPKEEYLYNDQAEQNPGWPKVTFNE